MQILEPHTRTAEATVMKGRQEIEEKISGIVEGTEVWKPYSKENSKLNVCLFL